MKISINEDCTACGLCVDLCPDVYQMGDEFAEVIANPIPADFETLAQQAADECPVEAIIVE